MRFVVTLGAFLVSGAVVYGSDLWMSFGGGDVSTSIPVSILVALVVFFGWRVVEILRGSAPSDEAEFKKKLVICLVCLALAVGFVACSEQDEWLTEAARENSEPDEGESDTTPTTAEEAASHYYYDSEGHIHRDY